MNKTMLKFIFLFFCFSLFVSFSDIKEMKVNFQSNQSSIKKMLVRKKIKIIDSFPIYNGDYLFFEIARKTEINLNKGIVSKFGISLFDKNNKKTQIKIYRYKSSLLAKKNKEIIDSLFILNAKQIDSFLFDLMHKSDNKYFIFNECIINTPARASVF